MHLLLNRYFNLNRIWTDKIGRVNVPCGKIEPFRTYRRDNSFRVEVLGSWRGRGEPRRVFVQLCRSFSAGTPSDNTVMKYFVLRHWQRAQNRRERFYLASFPQLDFTGTLLVSPYKYSGKSLWRGRLSNVDLLVEIACFVKKTNQYQKQLMLTRRSIVLIL
jgi:hypothetical protein